MFKKILIKLLVLLPLICLSISFNTYAQDITTSQSKVNTVTNDHLNILKTPWSDFTDLGNSDLSAKWIKWLLFNIANSLKYLFYVLATIFFLIITYKILFAENTEEEFWKYKKWIIWITVWLVVMQLASFFVTAMYDKSVTDWVFAKDLINMIISPLIKFLETLAAIFFLWVAIYSFIRLLSAWWDEEKIKKWKNSIIYAIIWFFLVKIARFLVDTIYWKYNSCKSFWSWGECIIKVWDLSDFSKIFLNIINWVNWFVAIITVLMIIYAWTLILFSGWDDEKLKKWKNIIVYALIWIFILVISYLILTFFIWPDWSKIITTP